MDEKLKIRLQTVAIVVVPLLLAYAAGRIAERAGSGIEDALWTFVGIVLGASYVYWVMRGETEVLDDWFHEHDADGHRSWQDETIDWIDDDEITDPENYPKDPE